MVTKPLGANHYQTLIIQITIETNSGLILFFYARFPHKSIPSEVPTSPTRTATWRPINARCSHLEARRPRFTGCCVTSLQSLFIGSPMPNWGGGAGYPPYTRGAFPTTESGCKTHLLLFTTRPVNSRFT